MMYSMKETSLDCERVEFVRATFFRWFRVVEVEKRRLQLMICILAIRIKRARRTKL